MRSLQPNHPRNEGFLVTAWLVTVMAFLLDGGAHAFVSLVNLAGSSGGFVELTLVQPDLVSPARNDDRSFQALVWYPPFNQVLSPPGPTNPSGTGQFQNPMATILAYGSGGQSSGGRDYAFGIDMSNNLLLSTHRNYLSDSPPRHGPTVPTNQWVMVAATYRNVTHALTYYVYNGTHMFTSTAQNQENVLDTRVAKVMVGKRPATGSHLFPPSGAYVGYVRAWTRVLSQAELLDASRFTTTTNPLSQQNPSVFSARKDLNLELLFNNTESQIAGSPSTTFNDAQTNVIPNGTLFQNSFLYDCPAHADPLCVSSVCLPSSNASTCFQCVRNYHWDVGMQACVCDDSQLCNGHGTCTETIPLQCLCNTGFDLPFCASCQPNLYPPSACNVQCIAADTCGGRGVCSVNGTCICNTGFGGAACDRCKNEFYLNHFPICNNSTSNQDGKNLGATIGGVVGGLIGLVLLVLLCGYLRKRNQAQDSRRKLNSEGSNAVIMVSSSTSSVPPSRMASMANSVTREIAMDDLSLGDLVGEGNSAVVHYATWRGTEVAVKIPKQTKIMEMAMEEVKRESDIYATVGSHPRVIPCHGANVTGSQGSVAAVHRGTQVHPELQGRPFLVFEFAPNGSLEDLLVRNRKFPLVGVPPEKAAANYRVVLQLALDCSSAILHLHKQNVIHRDIAARNFLGNREHRAFVSDFGMSVVLEGDETVFKGSKQELIACLWCAPEVLRSRSFSRASDVYAFGVLLFELVAQREPYEMSQGQTFDKSVAPAILKDDNPLRPRIPDWCPAEMSHLMQSCWCPISSVRLNMEQVNTQLKNMLNAPPSAQASVFVNASKQQPTNYVDAAGVLSSNVRYAVYA